MADIRRTGLLDDFNRPAENPVKFPWINGLNGRANMALSPHSLTGTQLTGTSGAYLSTAPILPSNPRSVEIWAQTSIDNSALIGDHYRLDCMTPAGIGYEFILGSPASGLASFLRRYDASGFVDLSVKDFSLGISYGTYLMIRLNDTVFEGWHGSPDASTWTLVDSVVDTTYSELFYCGLSQTGNEIGWISVGGGTYNRSFFYRWIPTN